MKRILTLMLAAAMTLGATSGAQAIDFKASGEWLMGLAAGDASLVQKDDDGKHTDTNDVFGAGQRVRLQLDAVASEALSGTVFFEIGDQLWGNGESGAADALKPKRNAQAAEPREQSNVASDLSQDELILYNAIKKQRSIHIDLLPEISGFEMRKCLPLLTMLELKRLVKKSAGGIFEIID